MPNIEWIEDDDATGQAAEVYAAWKKANPGRTQMPGILKCFSQRPDFLKQVIDFGNTIHFSEGHLTRRTKEMIATLVSGLNQCPY
jgi:alkylhydroperoxidase family enzyme